MNARQHNIIQLVTDKGRMSVSELAKTFNVSEVTIRQDLTLLEKQSYLRRQHGAAVPLDNDNVETRMLSNFSQKRDIAQFASTLVAPGETVFIENGSCNALLARILAETKATTIVTVSSYIAHLLKDSPGEVILLGGIYQKTSESMVGPLTRFYAQNVHFNKAFIGIDGWQPDTGFTSRDMLRADVVNAVLEKGGETIILSDSSKFGAIHPYPLRPTTHLHRLVTDDGLNEEIRLQLTESGLSVDIVHPV
ncbi:DeoR family transcriptional regulator [Superficieibacter electus]|uniref:DeoR family transcriptional regulator n=1 Tax=Superficieibacter electus TaxID=2022662 RepID=A0A2P5GV31_9ENTR|nr:DNA-binding transcriptional regulator YciT [Superficieibacter electus]POP44394.1 DeoR family transcriptional regulator [Superficieibacter electus]POP50412.1 DeoR family transcriptional regulator [Superficieibacter electus]